MVIRRKPPISRKLLAGSKLPHLPLHEAGERIRDGDALTNEICHDQQSDTASPRKVHWLRWGPYCQEGSYLARSPTTENVELGDKHHFNRRSGNGHILR